MKRKSFGWYLGAAVAGMMLLALATCISAIVIKFTILFLTWIF